MKDNGKDGLYMNVNVRVDTGLQKDAKLNVITKAAIVEYEEMRRNPDAYKRYHSVDELFDEVLRDV